MVDEPWQVYTLLCVFKKDTFCLSWQGPDGKEGFAGSHGLPVRGLILLHICGSLFFTIMLIDAHFTFVNFCYYSLQGIPGLQGPPGAPGAPGCNGTDVRKYFN